MIFINKLNSRHTTPLNPSCESKRECNETEKKEAIPDRVLSDKAPFDVRIARLLEGRMAQKGEADLRPAGNPIANKSNPCQRNQCQISSRTNCGIPPDEIDATASPESDLKRRTRLRQKCFREADCSGKVRSLHGGQEHSMAATSASAESDQLVSQNVSPYGQITHLTFA